jgi:hypothetical protein
MKLFSSSNYKVLIVKFLDLIFFIINPVFYDIRILDPFDPVIIYNYSDYGHITASFSIIERPSGII